MNVTTGSVMPHLLYRLSSPQLPLPPPSRPPPPAHKGDSCDGLSWQVKRCRVAPNFPGEDQPAGHLVHMLTLQQLEDVNDHTGLGQCMFRANNEETKAPQLGKASDGSLGMQTNWLGDMYCLQLL